MKKFLSGLLVLVMIFGLVACSTAKPVEPQAPAAEAPATETPAPDIALGMILMTLSLIVNIIISLLQRRLSR